MPVLLLYVPNGMRISLIYWKRLRNGFNKNNIHYKIITVPGAFELGFAIKNYWDNHKYKDDKPHAFIALGCVLKGDTPHFEYVCRAVTDGIVQLNLSLTRTDHFWCINSE